ncbi:hypothetical protein SNEBB_006852 [Seison nebaliae]|nr:hypothetical protein SNEBB_006852 [Seison nebaliae]
MHFPTLLMVVYLSSQLVFLVRSENKDAFKMNKYGSYGQILYFSQTLHPYIEVNANGNITLTCSIRSSESSDILWYKNDELIYQTNLLQIERSYNEQMNYNLGIWKDTYVVQTSHLFIPCAQYTTNNIRYSCVVRNHFKTIQSNTIIQVNEHPLRKHHRFLSRFNDMRPLNDLYEMNICENKKEEIVSTFVRKNQHPNDNMLFICLHNYGKSTKWYETTSNYEQKQIKNNEQTEDNYLAEFTEHKQILILKDINKSPINRRSYISCSIDDKRQFTTVLTMNQRSYLRKSSMRNRLDHVTPMSW